MRAVLVEPHGDGLATVRLTPCRLAQWLGARETLVKLVRVDPSLNGEVWRAIGSFRWLSDLPYYLLICNALDFVPVAMPPRAIARSSDDR